MEHAANTDDAPLSPIAAHFVHLSRDRVYLNAAGRSPLPKHSLAVGLAAQRKKAETPWDIGDTEADREAIRALFAAMIGTEPRNIATAPSCSYAMTLAANNLQHKLTGRCSRVLVLQDQMASHVLPWQDLCTRAGGSLLVVPRPADFDWTREVLAALDTGAVAVCALPPCHWCDGAVLDLEAVGAACAAHDAALVVDATQWLGGGTNFDVRRLGPALQFVAASVHSWLLNPRPPPGPGPDPKPQPWPQPQPYAEP